MASEPAAPVRQQPLTRFGRGEVAAQAAAETHSTQLAARLEVT